MSTIITSIDSGSPAMRAGLRPGQQLLSINGHTVVDVLDYRFYGYDPVSHLTLKNEDGSTQLLTIHKDEGEDLGLNFDTYLMDEMRSCANHCIFCFVDQMPPGMRETLYFKDDDARLSFLQGNYITLTISPSGRPSASLTCVSAPSMSLSTPRTRSSTAPCWATKMPSAAWTTSVPSARQAS